MHREPYIRSIVGIVVLSIVISAAPAAAEVRREVFTAGSRSLVVEILDDDLAHFDIAHFPASPADPAAAIFTTPMVARTDYPGPLEYRREGDVVRTKEMAIQVEPGTLCVRVTDLIRGMPLGRVCAEGLDRPDKTVTIHPDLAVKNVYGLGNFFYDTFTADGDWIGREWRATGYGNIRRPFDGAAPTESQFPVLYALAEGTRNFALFFDHPYKISWDFRNPRKWTGDTWGDHLRWYVMTGPDLKDLRRDFMELTGRPPVPPRSVFGLWVSKFGYLNWDDMRLDLESLRKNHFPLDGFGLDIQWFGGTFNDATNARMGTLWFDSRNFPKPERGVTRLLHEQGVHLMPVEEPYVDDRLAEHRLLVPPQAPGCFLARTAEKGCSPVRLGDDRNPLWWGRGGMIDWTAPQAGRYWHDLRRRDLSLLGITAHWLDLGEPEMFDPRAWYHGVEPGKNRHIDIHNLYNLLWTKSIHDGYTDAGNQSMLAGKLGLPAPPRYFSMSRAGAPGIQRFGGGLWSGDIGRNMGSLRAHLNTQMHLSLAGIDYYNSDVGGFIGTHGFGIEPGHTDAELYTQWFADSALGEIPLRPHGWSYSNEIPTFGPDRQGHRASNRANLLLRYELFPYVYSLAHRAYRFGEPIFPPLVYHFQEDAGARTIASVKMIGDSLLYGVVVGFAQTERRVYLPRGRWVHYHTREWISSNGEETPDIPLYLPLPKSATEEEPAARKTEYMTNGAGHTMLALPLFARAGAIIPTMFADTATLNISGLRSDGRRLTDLRLRVFAAPEKSTFTLYEDDGVTLAYQQGAVRETPVWQQLENGKAVIWIGAARGNYADAPRQREVTINLVVDDMTATAVAVDGLPLRPCPPSESESSGTACWANVDRNLVTVKTGPLPVNTEKRITVDLKPVPGSASAYLVCTSLTTQPGEAVFAVGSVPQLGNWDTDKAVRMLDIRYPRWVARIEGLQGGTAVEWKCIKRSERGGPAVETEPGPNHSFVTPNSGFAGTFKGTVAQ